MKIRNQYNYNYSEEIGIEVSDEILTLPDEAYSIRQLMARAVARTMPDVFNPGYYDSDDNEEIDFNSIIFRQITDITDLQDFKKDLEELVNTYDFKINDDTKKTAEPEPPKEKLAQPENDEE